VIKTEVYVDLPPPPEGGGFHVGCGFLNRRGTMTLKKDERKVGSNSFKEPLNNFGGAESALLDPIISIDMDDIKKYRKNSDKIATTLSHILDKVFFRK